MYTKAGSPSHDLASAFIDYMYSDAAKKIAVQQQILSMSDIRREVLNRD
jgi:ABC-type Fe3+ transport system substrate-binding protein